MADPSTSPTRTGWRALAARVRWYELLPEVLLVAGLGFFALDEPHAASSAFASGRAVTLMVVTAAVWLVARVASLAAVPWAWVRGGVFAVAAAVVLSVVVLPAYDDTTVIEAFPGAPTSAAAPAAEDPASAPSAPAPTTSTTAPATVAPSTVEPAPASPVPSPAPDTAPPEPVLLATGTVEGIDHRASGRASIYRSPDGSLVVGLEDIDIQPGPDYDVYVVPGADRDDIDGGVRLDDLRGNIGTQFYVVGPEADLTSGAWTVLVWCQTFGVPVANATPEAP
jgi:hypothetical protein